ncbi:acylphosphatase [Lentibacillus jeotgali]|uniref:acylphosphatase n=1 Tax=Lentibacillus jeotgali TaxID=558169 RepID=UPI0002626485|nr:acylphosphatase [Lentibacillus jeotgali]
MEEGYPNWLSKQMLYGVRRFNIDSFLVALEGWRRGLSLTFYSEHFDVTDLQLIGFEPTGKTFSLSSKERTHYFYRSRGDRVANDAVDIGSSKEKTKVYLQKAGVPVPEGFSFSKEEDLEDVIQAAKKIGFPLVVKPTFGSLGKGIITNIKSDESLRDSLAYVFSEFEYTEFIIERHISGEDIRVYVIGDQAICATKRVPANVTGDGAHTIEELIELKNEIRTLNPQTSTRLIKVDDNIQNFLSLQKLQLTDIPKEGTVIYLKGQSNISSGGDSVDVTEELSDDIKNTAINAVKAIPGLIHAGTDIIVNESGAVIIEINATAGISLHTFPLYGEARNVAEKIVDFYFPEMKGGAAGSTTIYFDYKAVLELLRSRTVKVLELTNAPVGKLYAKRYVISGEVQGVGFRRWLQKQAVGRGLHGYTRNLRNGKLVVVVGDTDKSNVDAFKDICYEGPEQAKVSNIQEYIWDKQIKIGFEIRSMNKARKS